MKERLAATWLHVGSVHVVTGGDLMTVRNRGADHLFEGYGRVRCRCGPSGSRRWRRAARSAASIASNCAAVTPTLAVAAIGSAGPVSSIRSRPSLDVRTGEVPAVGDQLLLVGGLEVQELRLGREAQGTALSAGSRDGDVKPRWTGTEDTHRLVPADEQPGCLHRDRRYHIHIHAVAPALPPGSEEIATLTVTSAILAPA